MNKPLTIGHLARAAEVNIETVRYYQRVGLIQEPKKPTTGYRVYSNEIVDRLKFIKRAKDLGFSLKEIIELLELGDGRCRDVQLRAEQKRTLIDQQISDLKKLRKTLDNLIKTCQTETNKVHCPIVETLAGKR
jgi:MerR family mercuric resistance operon transcriptional regulator